MAVDVDSLYRTHGPMVLRRCRRLLRDEAKAVDAMQDVFVEILRRKDTLDNRAPAGLLLTTATNLCLNKLRTMRRKPEDAEDELIHQVASFGESESAEERTLARRFLDRLTLEEVAAEVDMSVSGVRKRLRALQAAVPAVKGVA